MRGSKRLAGVIAQIPSVKLDAFQALGATIGARILFPGNRIGNKQTINAARGCHPRIADRFDLTLACIRLHYLGQPSPLSALFERYASFFSLFETFEGYVEFFLLDDLVQNGQVQFYLPFDGFERPPLPQDVAEYELYMQNTMSFVSKRNSRIEEWVRRNGAGGNEFRLSF